MTSIRAMSGAACGLALVGYVGVGLGWPHSGSRVEQTFSAALEHRLSSAMPAGTSISAPDASATLHLSRLGRAAAETRFSRGAIISFAAPGGSEVSYTIVDAQSVTLGSEKADRQGRFLLITAEAGAGGLQGEPSTLRFIVDADGATTGLPFGLQTKPHAL